MARSISFWIRAIPLSFRKAALMKPSHTILAILFMASAAIGAQVVPATAGPAGVSASGTLHYDLRYSQTAQFYGGSQGDVQSSIMSGELTYASANESRPFSLTYSGGNIWNISGDTGGSGVFQHALVSQGFLARKWALNLSDDVSYLPEAPTTGFSGIPGVGSLPSGPGQPSQTILTLNTSTLDNIATIGFQDRLNYAWSLSIGGSSGLLRFIDNNGENSDTLMADATMTRRLDARNSIFGQYSYSRYSYSGTDIALGTNSLLLGINRQWSRRLTTIVSAGPSWIASSGVSSAGSPASPGSTMLSLNASADYQLRHEAATLSYFHGANSGAGYLLGAKINNVNVNFSRDFGRSLSVGVTGSYVRTTSLIAAQLVTDPNGQITVVPINFGGVTNAKYGGAQATRQLGRYMNAFVSYTAIDQSSSMQIAALGYNSNILSGVYQVIGFGIGYSPREVHLRK